MGCLRASAILATDKLVLQSELQDHISAQVTIIYQPIRVVEISSELLDISNVSNISECIVAKSQLVEESEINTTVENSHKKTLIVRTSIVDPLNVKIEDIAHHIDAISSLQDSLNVSISLLGGNLILNFCKVCAVPDDDILQWEYPSILIYNDLNNFEINRLETTSPWEIITSLENIIIAPIKGVGGKIPIGFKAASINQDLDESYTIVAKNIYNEASTQITHVGLREIFYTTDGELIVEDESFNVLKRWVIEVNTQDK